MFVLNDFFAIASIMPVTALPVQAYKKMLQGLASLVTALRTTQNEEAAKAMENFVKAIRTQAQDEEKLVASAEQLFNYADVLEFYGATENHFEDWKKRIGIVATIDIERNTKQQTITTNEQLEYDNHLFRYAGLVFILEYTAALAIVYHALPDKALQEQMFMDEKTDFIGFQAPGIRAGVVNKEALMAFIYPLLDTTTRNALLWHYYEYHTAIMSASPKQYHRIDKALHTFSLALIPFFIQRQFSELSDYFIDTYQIKTLHQLADYLSHPLVRTNEAQ